MSLQNMPRSRKDHFEQKVIQKKQTQETLSALYLPDLGYKCTEVFPLSSISGKVDVQQWGEPQILTAQQQLSGIPQT